HPVDVGRRLGRVVLVVGRLVLDGEGAVADLDAALVVHLVEVGHPAAGDLAVGRVLAGLRVAGDELDDVALDLLGGVGGAVVGGDQALGVLATAPLVTGGGVVVIARAARRRQQRERQQGRPDPCLAASQHGHPPATAVVRVMERSAPFPSPTCADRGGGGGAGRRPPAPRAARTRSR